MPWCTICITFPHWTVRKSSIYWHLFHFFCLEGNNSKRVVSFSLDDNDSFWYNLSCNWWDSLKCSPALFSWPTWPTADCDWLIPGDLIWSVFLWMTKQLSTSNNFCIAHLLWKQPAYLMIWLMTLPQTSQTVSILRRMEGSMPFCS